jgi:glycosyltransferase involved in cell wall biosynthesis
LEAVFSYHDSSGEHSEKDLVGADSSRSKLLQNLMEFDWDDEFLLIGHMGLSPVGWLLNSVMTKSSGYGIVLHGREAWDPKPAWHQHTLAESDVIISTTDYTRRTFSRVNRIDTANHEVLPLSLPPGRFGETGHSSETTDGNDSSFKVLTVSRLDTDCRYKGVDDVIRAIAKLRDSGSDVEYLVIGDGDDRARLEELTQNLGVSSSVRFVGSITDDCLQKHFEKADVFAMPSTREGFGLVFLEAMSFGLPIIASPERGANYVIKDGENGLSVPANSPGSVAAAIEKLMDDEYRESLREGALQDVAERFSFTRFCDDLEKILPASRIRIA